MCSPHNKEASSKLENEVCILTLTSNNTFTQSHTRHLISFLVWLYPPKIIDRILIEVIQMLLHLPFLFLLSKIQAMVAPDAVTSQCLDLQRMTALPIIQIMNSPEIKLDSIGCICKKEFYSMCSQ